MTLDYIVIGGGISGLSAAFKCQKLGKHGIVLESDKNYGGCIQTISADNSYHESGGHSCFNSYKNLLTILDDMPYKLEFMPIKKPPFLLWEKYQIHSILKKINLPLLILSLFKIPFLKKNNKTVNNYYSNIVGKKNYHAVIKHALSAVSSQDVATMPANFLFQKRIKNKQVPRKFTFQKGLSQMIDAIGKCVTVYSNHRVIKIKQIDKIWHIETNNQVFKSKKLIIATDVKTCHKLLNNINKDITNILAEFQLSTIDSTMIMINEPLPKIKTCAGWIGINANFYSMISKDTKEKPLMRAFTFHFKSNLPPTIDQKTFIKKILNLKDSQITKWFSKQNILPIIDSDHYQKIQQLQQSLPDNLAITGNYFQGMSIEDCVTRSFDESKRLFS